MECFLAGNGSNRGRLKGGSHCRCDMYRFKKAAAKGADLAVNGDLLGLSLVLYIAK